MAVDKNRTGHEDKSEMINAACWKPHMSVECQRKRVWEQINVFVCWSFVVCAPFAEMIRIEESKAGGNTSSVKQRDPRILISHEV